MQQVAPVKVVVGVKHLALTKALLASGGANGVGGFLAEQWLVTTDHVYRAQGALQVFAELCGVEFHRGAKRGRLRGPASLLSRHWQLNRRLLGLRRLLLAGGFQGVSFSLELGFCGLLQLVQLLRADLLQAQDQ